MAKPPGRGILLGNQITWLSAVSKRFREQHCCSASGAFKVGAPNNNSLLPAFWAAVRTSPIESKAFSLAR
jgi:hypothetical protein